MSQVNEKKRCLIVVQGGIANFVCDDDMDVHVVDLDTPEGEDQFNSVPESFLDLVAVVR